MTQLSPDAQKLIAQTRSLDEPSPDDLQRLRARLDASWAAQASNPAGSVASVSGTSLRVWLGSSSLVALTSLGVMLIARPQPAPAVAPSRQTELEHASSRRAEAQPAPALDPDRVEALPATKRGAENLALESSRAGSRPGPTRAAKHPQPLAAGRVQPRAAAGSTRNLGAPRERTQDPADQLGELDVSGPAASQRAATAAARRAPATLHATDPPDETPARPVETERERFAPQPIADEVALLGEAQRALQSGRPNVALGYVQQHAFRFPHGALAQERLTVHALALCSLQRKAAARQVLGDLTRSGASSALIARIRSSCGL